MVRPFIRRLLSDDRAAVAVYVGVSAAVLFGAGALALDLSRYYTLHTELQQAADAAALAGAAELNGKDDAEDRANEAAALNNAAGAPFGANWQSFAIGEQNITVTQTRFLSSVDPKVVSTDPKQSRYIEVTVQTRQVPQLLRLTAQGESLKTTAQATAGRRQVACKIPPLMICNPYEPDSLTFDANRGEQIKVKEHASSWAPGTFGYLDAPNAPNQGAKATAQELGKGESAGCFGNELSVRPGNVASAIDALNVRFDMYTNNHVKSEKGNSAYRPASNVTKGRPKDGGACKDGAFESGGTKALPRDNTWVLGRFGQGDFNLSSYWLANHGTATPPEAFETRYDAYMWEINNGQIPTAPENGAPQCYSGAAAPTPDRRVIIFAVVNCVAENIGGNSTGFEATAYVKAFMTEPVTDDGELFLEVLEVANAQNSPSNIHDIVELVQ